MGTIVCAVRDGRKLASNPTVPAFFQPASKKKAGFEIRRKPLKFCMHIPGCTSTDPDLAMTGVRKTSLRCWPALSSDDRHRSAECIK